MLNLQVNGAGEIVQDERSKMMKSVPLESVAPPACPAHLLPEVNPTKSECAATLCMSICHGGGGKGKITAPASAILSCHCGFQVVRRRIHPGMMREFHRIPDSTMQDHFRWQAAAPPPVSFKHHFRKTDFSEYNEAAAQFAKHLVTDKGSSAAH